MSTPTCTFCDNGSSLTIGKDTAICLPCYGRLFVCENDTTFYIKCPECQKPADSEFTHDADGKALDTARAGRCFYAHSDDACQPGCRTNPNAPPTNGRYRKLVKDGLLALAKAFAKIGEYIELDESAKLNETEYDVELEYAQEEADRQRVLSYGEYDWRSMAFIAR